VNRIVIIYMRRIIELYILKFLNCDLKCHSLREWHFLYSLLQKQGIDYESFSKVSDYSYCFIFDCNY
jgi:hypothetical protein